MLLRLRHIARLTLTCIAIAGTIAATCTSRADSLSEDEVGRLNRTLIFGSDDERRAALDALVARGNDDALATLILAMRYRRGDPGHIEAFHTLTGETVSGWFDAMVWQEAHPEIKAHPGYRDVKLEVFERLDPAFLRFLGGRRSDPENLKIRLEEITWGGVAVDGIPALDYSKMIRADEAAYLRDDDRVFGVSINGDVRAYPLRILAWHEMFNDVVGDIPVTLAYCTLCGAGILFETKVDGQDRPFIFGSSGFLYRSNKLMFDRSTDSLWNQFTGEPVSGPLADDGIKLNILPVTLTSWGDWRARHPRGRVLSPDTGFERDYSSGAAYRDYFASPDLMFPAATDPESGLGPKDEVFGIRTFAAAKAWPLSVFADGAVINDTLNGRNIVLVGDDENGGVRAYERGEARFDKGRDPMHLTGPGGDWEIGEDALTGPDGTALPRLPGHVSYWFAWNSFLGVRSEIYVPQSAN